MSTRQVRIVAMIFLPISLLFVSIFDINVGDFSRIQAQTVEAHFSIEKQKRKERIFREIEFDLLLSIDFEKLAPILYKPDYCLLDKKRNSVFVFDGSERVIHRFDLDIEKRLYNHHVFGKGRGEGPGELNAQIPCIDLFKGRIYLSDPLNGAIQVYSTDGRFIRTLKPKKFIPEKIKVLSPNRIVVLPRGDVVWKKLFFELDSLGNIRSKFGPMVDVRSNNFIYQSGFFAPGINQRGFCYFWNDLDMFGYFCSNRWILLKELIDGKKQPALIRKEVLSGLYAEKLDWELAILNAKCNNQYFIVNVYNRKEERSYYDVYSRDRFDYLYSIRNFPEEKCFDISDRILICLEDLYLKVYKIESFQG